MGFLVDVDCLNNTINHIIIDKVVVGSMMYLACWNVLCSPMLSESMTMLISFDGNSFFPYGILCSLEVQLGGKNL